MEIKTCRIHQIAIPFTTSFKHSLAETTGVRSIVFEVELQSGTRGYGECVPRSYVTGETVGSVMDGLAEHIIPGLTHLSFASWQEVLGWLKEFKRHFPNLPYRALCTRTAFELAMLDAAGKEFGVHAASMLGGKKKESLKYSAIISAEKPEKVKSLLSIYKEAQFSEVKIKVGHHEENDTENILLAREILGAKASIRVDANASWDLPEAKRRLQSMAKLGVVSCEQPMPVSLKESYPALCEFVSESMYIAIDESLCSIEDGRWFAENRGATLFNLRVSKNGGLLSALELWEIAGNHGIACQLGAQVGETSLLSAAGRTLASITGDLIFHEGSFGRYLLKNDLTETSVEFGIGGIGYMNELEDSFGLGVDVNPDLLEEMVMTQAEEVA
ncbi:enolase C-terminal domain-like protein [Desulfoluna sp.]|uniref:mandelate racemase/muconate lactonizing enzyme family protein n=1 Tax=Desulfoluna sp. TaxID=2045199 RepID=UPI00262247EF|nr:enolase C-terminal domain-like protein [Desulfoluna sp.]